MCILHSTSIYVLFFVFFFVIFELGTLKVMKYCRINGKHLDAPSRDPSLSQASPSTVCRVALHAEGQAGWHVQVTCALESGGGKGTLGNRTLHHPIE